MKPTSRLLPLFFLGFSSGLPLTLTGGTLQAWFTDAGINLKTIGLLALLGQPYAFKFLWAPFFDRYALPFFSGRRGWIGMIQVVLFMSISTLIFLSPHETPFLIAGIILWIAFLSASQDTVIDAYRTEVLNPHPSERGLGNAFAVTGYRIAMLVSGGVALILADFQGWGVAFGFIAVLMASGLIATWKSPQPETVVLPPQTLSAAILEPFQNFFKKTHAPLILVFIILYKLGDAFCGSLTTTFLMRELHVSLTEVGVLNKGIGLLATLCGFMVGGLWLSKMGLFRSLILFGILQAVSNLGFMLLAYFGKNIAGIATTLFLENFAGGLGTVALLSFMMSLCDARFAATQFALLSALTAIGRIYVGPVSGWWVSSVGWGEFYFWTFWLAWPGIFILWSLRKKLPYLKPPFTVATSQV